MYDLVFIVSKLKKPTTKKIVTTHYLKINGCSNFHRFVSNCLTFDIFQHVCVYCEKAACVEKL